MKKKKTTKEKGKRMTINEDALNALLGKMVIELGAAYAAGIATGYWQGVDELKRNWGVSQRWRPSMPESRREHLYGSWQKAVARSFDWKQ